jgi:hypothetical protein
MNLTRNDKLLVKRNIVTARAASTLFHSLFLSIHELDFLNLGVGEFYVIGVGDFSVVPLQIRAAEELGHSRISVAAINMPMPLVQITGGRTADQEVSNEIWRLLEVARIALILSAPGRYGEQLTEAFVSWRLKRIPCLRMH